MSRSVHDFQYGDVVQRRSDGWTGIVVDHSALYAIVQWDGIDRTREEIEQHDPRFAVVHEASDRELFYAENPDGVWDETDDWEGDWDDDDDEDDPEGGAAAAVEPSTTKEVVS